MTSAAVTSKGQITIPLDVRRDLGLHAGSRVAFVRTDAGYELRPETGSIRDLKGTLSQPDVVVTVEDMNLAVADAVTERRGADPSV